MRVESFTREEFESKLPQIEWKHSFIQNEHCYIIKITADIFIMVRSSIGSDGMSAGTGQDSIRAWLVDSELNPLGSKVSKWTTRRPGWDERMIEVLRKLWSLAQFAGYCPDCRIPRGVWKVKKAGKNKGRIFSKCRQCDNHFEFMEE